MLRDAVQVFDFSYPISGRMLYLSITCSSTLTIYCPVSSSLMMKLKYVPRQDSPFPLTAISSVAIGILIERTKDDFQFSFDILTTAIQPVVGRPW